MTSVALPEQYLQSIGATPTADIIRRLQGVQFRLSAAEYAIVLQDLILAP